MTKKAVGYILRKFPVLSETFILNELLELEAQGTRLEIFSLEKPKEGPIHRLFDKLHSPITYLPQNIPESPLWLESLKTAQRFPLGCTRALWYCMRQSQPDLLLRCLQSCYIVNAACQRGVGHFHAHFATRATTVGFFASMISGIPYSFTAHAVDIFKNTQTDHALKMKLERARFVVTVSEFNQAFLSEKSPQSQKKILKIRNGIDLDFFQSAPNEKSPVFTFLCVARLVEKKGHKVLIEACRILKDQNPDFECRLLGWGPLGEEIRQAIKKYDLEKQVKLLGAKTQEEVLAHYRRSHAYILPCITGSDGNQDGLPVSIVEALACGLPVITTPLTGNPEVIKDRYNGLLVPCGDAALTAEAMRRLLQDAALYRDLCSRTRSSIETAFNLKNTAKRLANQFHEVIQ